MSPGRLSPTITKSSKTSWNHPSSVSGCGFHLPVRFRRSRAIPGDVFRSWPGIRPHLVFMATYFFFGFACLFSGLVTGGLLTLICSTAATSRSQERMQRKVHEAWELARHYRERCADTTSGHETRDRWETW